MTVLEYGSVCSGIEAASAAWHPIGWRPTWFAEIEKFPSAVLAHHYPDVPNLGDMTTIASRVLSGATKAPDALVGGTPCQAFSVAGLRESLADARGNLTIKYVELADAIDFVRRRAGEEEAIIVWENVPGVLSTKDNAFGCFLGALSGSGCELQPAGGRWADAGCVYGPKRAIAWRILDAQYFGLAQRRRRVFVVASARNGFDPVAVLFDQEGLRRDSAPRRETRKDIAPTISARTSGGGGLGTDFDLDGGVIVSTLDASLGRLQGCSGQDMNHGHSHLVPLGLGEDGELARALNGCDTASGRHDVSVDTFIAHTLRAEGFDASEDGTGRSTPLVPVAFAIGSHAGCADGDQTNRSHASGGPVGSNISEELAYSLRAGRGQSVASAMAVRRLTPTECERLQGFPDGYTDIHPRGKPTPDGPRYKALGNSMAVPVMAWIGRRIEFILMRLAA